MNCEELREHYDLYALDIAEEPERGEIRAHLNRGCEVCMAGVKRALETAALMGATAPPAQPSPKLRRRILASVGSERAPLQLAAWVGGWLWRWLLARDRCVFRCQQPPYAPKTPAARRDARASRSDRPPDASVRHSLRPPHHRGILRRRAAPAARKAKSS